MLSSAAELADAITVGENGLSRTEALRSLYYMVESVEQFLATAMRDGGKMTEISTSLCAAGVSAGARIRGSGATAGGAAGRRALRQLPALHGDSLRLPCHLYRYDGRFI